MFIQNRITLTKEAWHGRPHRKRRKLGQGSHQWRALNRESKRIPRSLTSTSSIRPEPFGSELKADLLMADGSRVAAGLVRVSENGKLPYGRRFPVPTSRDCRESSIESRAGCRLDNTIGIYLLVVI